MIKKLQKKHINKKGFTLVEILIAIFLLSVMFLLIFSTFLSFIDYQKRLQDRRNALENISQAVYEIERELYFATEFLYGEFYDTNDNTWKVPENEEDRSCLVYKNQLGRIVKITLDNGKIVKSESTRSSNNYCQTAGSYKFISTPLSGDSSNIDKLYFNISNSATTQSSVSIFVDANYSLKDETTEEFSIRSLVTGRIIDPDESILSNFITGTLDLSSDLQYYYVFNNAGQCVTESGDIIEAIENNTPCSNFLSIADKGISETPILHLDDGLVILREDGLLFFLKYNSTIKNSIKVTGPSSNSNNNSNNNNNSVASGSIRISTSSIYNGNDFYRIKGADCSGPTCDDDPNGIVELHLLEQSKNHQKIGNVFYATTITGALYKIYKKGNTMVGKKLLRGFPNERVLDISVFSPTTNSSRKLKHLILLRDDKNKRYLRFYNTGKDGLDKTDLLNSTNDAADCNNNLRKSNLSVSSSNTSCYNLFPQKSTTIASQRTDIDELKPQSSEYVEIATISKVALFDDPNVNHSPFIKIHHNNGLDSFCIFKNENATNATICSSSKSDYGLKTYLGNNNNEVFSLSEGRLELNGVTLANFSPGFCDSDKSFWDKEVISVNNATEANNLSRNGVVIKNASEQVIRLNNNSLNLPPNNFAEYKNRWITANNGRYNPGQIYFWFLSNQFGNRGHLFALGDSYNAVDSKRITELFLISSDRGANKVSDNEYLCRDGEVPHLERQHLRNENVNLQFDVIRYTEFKIKEKNPNE